MATLPDVVRQNELLNQLVLNRSTMEELGRIEVLWMYPPAHRVLGFVCKTGFLGRKKLAFKLSQVEAIGANGVLTHSQPDETDAERVSQLESLIQCEVWSNAGQKLGKIVDCLFNLRSGAIADYLVVGDRLSSLTGSIYRLPPSKIVSLGRERVLVAETSIHQLPAYREGIQEKLTKATTALKDEYEDVTQELRSLAKRAQETTQQTTFQIKTLADQAKERAQLLAEQAREKAQELNEQLLENAQTLAEKARETSETLVERVQDTTQTLTVQAREVFDSDNEEDERDFDWDEIDFLFDDDEETQPVSPATPPSNPPNPPPSTKQPVPPKPVQQPAATQNTAPQVSQESEEDVWFIDDDLTLKQAGWNPQTVFTPPNNENEWDLEDDPWDITEPPIPTTPELGAESPQSVSDESVDDEFAENEPVDDEFAENEFADSGDEAAVHSISAINPPKVDRSEPDPELDEDESWI
ncbi:MAG: PRC-barrel domain-containing protein [Oscillatoriales cyanobacterium C42_A2020_001]|nr:PRC-barrel domain-containing protein [Leptolyngbyaceae cyanobacterium C42_A2020_001]